MAANKNVFIKISVDSKQAAKQTKKTQDSIDGLTQSVKNNSKATKNNRTQTGLNNTILIETGRVASDAAYGMQGMANNIGRLIELGQEYARTGEGGLLGAFKTLGKSLMGVGGIIIGIQLLLSFLPQIIKKFKEWSGSITLLTETFKEAASGVESLNGNFELYVRTISDSKKSTEEKRDAIVNLRKEFPDFIDKLDESGISLQDLKDDTNDARDATDNYRKSIVKLAMAEAARKKISKLAGVILQNEVEQTQMALEAGFGSLDKALKHAEEGSKTLNNAFIATSRTSQTTLANPMKKLAEEIRDLNKEIVEDAQKDIEILLGFTNIKVDEAEKKAEKKKKDREKRSKVRGGISDELRNKLLGYQLEIDAIKELGRIQEFYANKNLDLDVAVRTHKLASIETEYNQAIASIEALGLAEELSQQARDNVTKFYSRSRVEAEKEALFDLGNAIVEAAGASSTVGKAVAASMSVINTYQGVTKALAEIKPPFSYIVAATTALQGFSAVRKILATDPMKTPTAPSGGGAGGTTVQAPNFNVVGASGTNQLAQAVGGQVNQPVRAFVVGSDVTNQQELDRRIVDTAGIG